MNQPEQKNSFHAFVWGLLFLTIGLRMMWQTEPGSMFWCVVFWVVVLSDDPFWWRMMGNRQKWIYGLSSLGALGNAVATIVNGGYMPVLGKEEAFSFWVPLNETHNVVWLCDIYDVGFGTASIGDFFIVASLIGLLLNWGLTKTRVFSEEPRLNGKRIPGFGL